RAGSDGPTLSIVTPQLEVNLAPGHKADLILRNPVMPASGTFSWGFDFAKHYDINRLGAVVSKGITVEPRSGNVQQRMAETPLGRLHAIGRQNVGIDAVARELAPSWAPWGVPVIANISGDTVGEFGDMARALDGVPGIAALELNISCPNVDRGGIEIGQDPVA